MTSTTRIACLVTFCLTACSRDTLPTTSFDMTTAVDFTLSPDMSPDCSGSCGKCAENGHLEIVAGKTICSTDPGGSESVAKPQTCSGYDDNCDCYTDEGCPEATPGGKYLRMALSDDGGSGLDVTIGWKTEYDWTTAWLFCSTAGLGSHWAQANLVNIPRTGQVTITIPAPGTYRCQMQGKQVFNPSSWLVLWSDIITITR